MAGANSPTRPALAFADLAPLRDDLIPTPDPETLALHDFALLHPSERFDPAHRPVRGDLAHIRCAGRVFVPHYAVPMPHRLTADARLTRAARADADVLEALAAGAAFNVLDIAGGWAWGQVGDDGYVGYLPMTVLQPL